MKELVFIIDRIEGGFILPAAVFELDADEAIRTRSMAEFREPWQRANAYVLEAIERATIPSQERNYLVALREVAFIRAFDHTEHPELAGQISDDFGLIGSALLSRCEDDWLNALWMEYREGRIPLGTLKPTGGSLLSLLQFEAAHR
jgi:hypothetical protein